MSEGKKPFCANCVFWISLKEKWSGAYDDCDDGPLQMMGMCRRYPPAATGKVQKTYLALVNEAGEPVGEREPVDYRPSEFPYTDDYDWCGEHRPMTRNDE